MKFLKSPYFALIMCGFCSANAVRSVIDSLGGANELLIATFVINVVAAFFLFNNGMRSIKSMINFVAEMSFGAGVVAVIEGEEDADA